MPDKREYTEPKLEFVEPRITKHGDVTKITGGNGFLASLVLRLGSPKSRLDSIINQIIAMQLQVLTKRLPVSAVV